MTQHILIVNEDIDKLNETFECINTRNKYNVLSASSGEMAVEIIEKKILQVVVLDWDTILNSKIDILQNKRKYQAESKLILITDNQQLENNKAFIREHKARILDRNFSKKGILALIARVLEEEKLEKKITKSSKKEIKKNISQKDLKKKAEEVEREKKTIKKVYQKIKQEKEKLENIRKKLEDDKKDLVKQQKRLTKDENKLLARQIALEKQNKPTSDKNQDESYQAFLTHILPHRIRKTLETAKEKSIQLHPEVSVLVLHWHNIGFLKTKVDHSIIIKDLQRLTTAFEKKRISANLEKIRTNGLDYVLIQGIEGKAHAPEQLLKIAEVFKDIIDTYQRYKKSKRESYLYASISIQTGQLVAGTVDKQLFAFDIWGEITQKITTDKFFNVTPILMSENTMKCLDPETIKQEKVGKLESKQYGTLDVFKL